MSAHSSEEKTPQPGSLQAMLARLRGMMQALKSSEPVEPRQQELLPTWDDPARTAQDRTPYQDLPDTLKQLAPPGTETAATEDQLADGETAPAVALEKEQGTDSEATGAPGEPGAGTDSSVTPAAPQVCPYCRAPRNGEQVYCGDCGWIFPVVDASPPPKSALTTEAPIKDRYVLGAKIGERHQVARFRGVDQRGGGAEPVPVIIVRAPFTAPVEAVPAVEPAIAENELAPPANGAARGTKDLTASATVQDEPAVAEQAVSALGAVPLEATWPSLEWEQALLLAAANSSLPRVLDHFTEGDYSYLIEELPAGQALWDAWDDPQYSAEQRFTWLKQIAGALHRLHQSGAILEGLRPDIVTVAAGEHATITDLSDLLPLPLPPDPPIKATWYTAPELVLFSDQADARSDLYSFGAMLYALHMGRELTELDFELQGVPKSIYQRFPDIHPLFGRLISKTFCRELARRFPTEEASREDATGFSELIRVLENCRRTLDHVRLDIAAWTTTGMVRSGNEDAFGLLHATESSENILGDCSIVLLADGMGGYEAGEVAAAMAIHAMRKYLLTQKPFTSLAGEATSLPDERVSGEAHTAVDRSVYKQLLATALRQANKEVYMAAHSAAARRGMGCTAEAVYVSGRDVIVGHVGDSRTYHFQAGNLVQVTRDQTWVNRMVELGAMTAAEAEEHPRRSELQQAIGGYPDVEPALYDATLKPGDWIVICSDGLTNHVGNEALKDLLQRSTSAEAVARRLVNLANLDGATDNVTVVVVRAT